MLLDRPADLGARKGRVTVVIGAGAVGLYLAGELVQRGHQVIVIEAGGAVLDNFSEESYVSIGRPHEGIAIGRSRSLGGTSNLWGGQLAEFQPIDFEGRDWLPGSRWPVTYEEIAPYYLRVYGSFTSDDDVWSAVHRARPSLGEDLEVFLTRWLAVPSFAARYRSQVERSPDLLVLANHTAVGFRGSGTRIVAVTVIDADGVEHAVNGDAFVVAAGTIETVRLLLHSAATTGWDCPWRANRHLGSYFHDHIGGPAAVVQPDNHRLFFKTFCNIVLSGQKYQPKLRLTNSALRTSQLLNVHGMFTFDSSVTENLVYLKQFVRAAIYSRRIHRIRELPVHLRAAQRFLLPIMWAYARDHRIFEPKSSRVSFVVQSEQTPIRQSRIRIDPSSTDRTGLSKVVLDWRLGEGELDSIREFTIRSDRALRKAHLGRLQIDPRLGEGNPSFLSTLRDTNHQAGGAIMGESQEDGVVDSDLRVFGTANMYVAGASTFRTVSGANTTLTALAFAARLVDHLVAHDAAG